jgi:hypothetical protein
LVALSICIGATTISAAGDFNITLGSNPDWPANGLGPVNFTMTDQYGFQLDGSGAITRFGGTALTPYPDEVTFFGAETSLGLVYDASSGNGGVGESTNTATLSFSSGGSPIAVDALSFIVSDIDASDNNAASDRCDFVTLTGDNGNPTLTYVSTNASTRSVIIGPGSGSGATGAIAANQAQCIYNTGTTGSPNSAGDTNGSILATYPAGTSVATIAYDESIENVYGVTNRNAAARGVGIWAGSAITVDQSISLSKTATSTHYSASGQTITYDFVVTNDGPLPINTGQDIQIQDDQIGTFTCGTISSDIAAGGTVSCSANYTVTLADMSAPNVTNNAIAGVGTPAQSFATRLQSGTATEVVLREIPALTVTKTAGTPTVALGGVTGLTDGGDTIAYSFLVNNTGNVELTNVSITDPGPTFNGSAATGTLSAFSPASATIAAGGSQLFTATYTLSQTDVDNSYGVTNGVANTASASGTAPSSTIVTAPNSSDTTTISGGVDLTISKVASAPGFITGNVQQAPVGTVVTYTYMITNAGNVTIDDVLITDVHNGAGPPPVPANEALTTDNGTMGDSTDAVSNDGIWSTLSPGDIISFTDQYIVTQLDVDNQ